MCPLLFAIKMGEESIIERRKSGCNKARLDICIDFCCRKWGRPLPTSTIDYIEAKEEPRSNYR
jgi:hypothetical protein